MIANHSLYALIPARGGSKGIPRKNLYELSGMSLVERSVRLAKRCEQVDKVFVSTEDTEITKLAKRLKAATPSLRPAKLASDGSKTIDTLSHLVAENLLSKNDCVLLLQPTTPLRTLDNLDVACKLLFDNWKRYKHCESENKYFNEPKPMYYVNSINDLKICIESIKSKKKIDFSSLKYGGSCFKNIYSLLKKII